MAKGHINDIYQQLVKNDQDIAGILAYSIYKREKIEHIEINGYGKVQNFTKRKCEPSEVEKYRNKGEAALVEIVKAQLELVTATVRTKLAKEYPWKQNIIAGLAGSAIWFILLAVIYWASKNQPNGISGNATVNGPLKTKREYNIHLKTSKTFPKPTITAQHPSLAFKCDSL